MRNVVAQHEAQDVWILAKVANLYYYIALPIWSVGRKEVRIPLDDCHVIWNICCFDSMHLTVLGLMMQGSYHLQLDY